MAVLAFGAWLICYAPDCSANSPDVALMQWFARQRIEGADALFRWATWLGSLFVLAPLAAAVSLALLLRQRVREACFVAATLGGVVVMVHASKLLVARPRPAVMDAVVEMPWDQSFPSAHTAQIAAFLAGLLLLVAPARRTGLMWLTAVGLVALVACSRVYLQVHYPSDVLAGALAGALWVAGLAKWMRPRPR